MLLFYSSSTNNTKKFVTKLELPAVQINGELGADTPLAPFVLFTPTYSNGTAKGSVPKSVRALLVKHSELLVAVVGFGNRNFGELFCVGARLISHRFNVPLLHCVELAGTTDDVALVTERLEELGYYS